MFREPRQSRRCRSIRLRAALAGGLVLGVGAVFTLASWTDSESATGSFGASTFVTQSSSNGTTFVSNPTSPGATLVFAPTAIAPGIDGYTFLDIRTTTATTVAGTVALAAATATNVGAGTLASVLQYRAIQIPVTTACAAAAFIGSPLYVAGSSTTTLAVGSVPATPIASAIAAGGGSLRYCFDVQVPATAPNADQGMAATLTWQFSAISS